MPVSRRRFNQSLLAALAVGLVPTRALARDTAQELVEGRDWAALSPAQPGDSPGKIEVLEFFSYGCGHCRDLHPLITPWVERLPKDVSFRQVPVTFGRAAWANLGRMHYALEAGGQLANMQHAVFEAIHKHKVNLYTEKTTLEWLEKQGVDIRRFSETFPKQCKKSEKLAARAMDYLIQHPEERCGEVHEKGLLGLADEGHLGVEVGVGGRQHECEAYQRLALEHIWASLCELCPASTRIVPAPGGNPSLDTGTAGVVFSGCPQYSNQETLP
jgi:thiol:disulfide interchange protein DsbA